MSLRPEPSGPIPEQTAQVARAAFPKGNVYMQMRDVLGVVYNDASLAHLFARQGRPAESPWRLALVTVMQFREGLSDRQAAESVRARIDWKYALGLELTDPGFDYSVLSEFRARLVDGSAELLLLSSLLDACQAKGYLRLRGRQRTDSTHVLAVLRLLSRLEHVAETLRQALNALAKADPEWLRAHLDAHLDPEWFERYGRRIEEYRLPKAKEARQEFARVVGLDGMRLLGDVYAADSPPTLRTLAEVETLRQTWIQQYVVLEDQVTLRDPKNQPPVSKQTRSPYEPEARFGTKGAREWIGYKLHLTESCDEDIPRLLIHVETTIATTPDVVVLERIHEGLAGVGLLPAEHLVDSGYVGGAELAASQKYQIDLIGPVLANQTWQARADEGFDASKFKVDWGTQVVTCPEGHQSIQWCPIETPRGKPKIHVGFSKIDCQTCLVRDKCTRAKNGPRSLTLLPEVEWKALEAARERERTEGFWSLYARRAGIEGTLSQGVRAFGLRYARYQGLAKTKLQHLATAAAIDLGRLDDWLNQVPRARTRTSRFAALVSLN